MNLTTDTGVTINNHELKPLFRTKPQLHALAMLYNWLIIFLAIGGCLTWPNFATYFTAVVIIGARMHALAILMHDATHYRFLKNRKWNDRISNYFTMFPIFTTIEKYRKNHLKHHQHLNTEHDPDWVAKLGKRDFQFPKTKKEFLLTIAAYLTFYNGILDAIWLVERYSDKTQKQNIRCSQSLEQISFYLVLIAALSILGVWKYYFLFWIIPYFTTFFMFQYIRSVAEHFGELAYDHPLSSSRTVRPTLIEKFLIAPHHVGYHLEHHLYPGVPFYNLPKLHRLLMAQDAYKAKAHITKGYTQGLLQELGA